MNNNNYGFCTQQSLHVHAKERAQVTFVMWSFNFNICSSTFGEYKQTFILQQYMDKRHKIEHAEKRGLRCNYSNLLVILPGITRRLLLLLLLLMMMMMMMMTMYVRSSGICRELNPPQSIIFRTKTNGQIQYKEVQIYAYLCILQFWWYNGLCILYNKILPSDLKMTHNAH